MAGMLSIERLTLLPFTVVKYIVLTFEDQVQCRCGLFSSLIFNFLLVWNRWQLIVSFQFLVFPQCSLLGTGTRAVRCSFQ